MTNASDEEQECFLSTDECESKSLSEGDECESKSLGEVDDIHISFAGASSVNKGSEKICRAAVTRCKSVEVLKDRTQCTCIGKTLSKSVSIINDEKTCIITQEAFESDSSVSEKLIQDTPKESMCKCNRGSRSCGALMHPTHDEHVVHYVNGDTNKGVVAVTLQHLNGHVLADLRNDTDSAILTMQQQQQNHVYGGVAYETSQSSDANICRICHSSGDEKLIAPCKCAGSSQYVHEPCLVTWFKKTVKNECELCKSVVKIKKINHSLTRWRKPEDRPIPLIWFSVFFIGLFLNILSIHVNASEYCKSTACLIFYIVNGFGIILDSAFLYFWFLKCRHYCKKWFALNQDWFIDDLDNLNNITTVEYVRSDSLNPV